MRDVDAGKGETISFTILVGKDSVNLIGNGMTGSIKGEADDWTGPGTLLSSDPIPCVLYMLVLLLPIIEFTILLASNVDGLVEGREREEPPVMKGLDRGSSSNGIAVKPVNRAVLWGIIIVGVMIIGTGTGRRVDEAGALVKEIFTGIFPDSVGIISGRLRGMGNAGKVSFSRSTFHPLSPNTGFSGDVERSDNDPSATAAFDGDSSSNAV